MQKKSGFKYHRIALICGCVVLSFVLILVFMNFSAAASAQAAVERAASVPGFNSPEKTYVIEFFYNDAFSKTAAIAANNFARLLAKETSRSPQPRPKTAPPATVITAAPGSESPVTST